MTKKQLTPKQRKRIERLLAYPFEQDTGNGTNTAVLYAICFGMQETDVYAASAQELAKAASCHWKTVLLAVQDLERRGLIEVERHRRPNRYRLAQGTNK